MKLKYRILAALMPLFRALRISVIDEVPTREWWENGYRRVEATGPVRTRLAWTPFAEGWSRQG